MAFWYEGNRNLAENRRECDGITYYVRGYREVAGERYERYGIHTHFIEQGENLQWLLAAYVSPLYQPGDILFISEKVVAMCQNDTVNQSDVHPGFWAKTLSRFATRNQNGIGMDEPYKLQLAIDMKGLPLVLWACVRAVIGRLFGKRGVFYEVVGRDVAGIDGFYSHSAFERYRTLAVLNPHHPEKACAAVQEGLHIFCVVVDANDIAVEILGKSPGLAHCEDTFLQELVRDNPAGQDDELTPFILVRPVGDGETEPFVPLVPIEPPQR